MLEALLDPAEACAAEVTPATLGGLARASSAPDDQVLAILRGLPELECLLSGGIVASWHSSFGSLHSRRWHRVAYTKPLLITPLDDVSGRPCERAFVARARDVSLSGVSFCHAQPLASRRVIVRFRAEDRSGASAGILAMLRWCRFRRDGFYQSGGKFVRCVPARDAVADCECTPQPTTECSPAF